MKGAKDEGEATGESSWSGNGEIGNRGHPGRRGGTSTSAADESARQSDRREGQKGPIQTGGGDEGEGSQTSPSPPMPSGVVRTTQELFVPRSLRKGLTDVLYRGVAGRVEIDFDPFDASTVAPKGQRVVQVAGPVEVVEAGVRLIKASLSVSSWFMPVPPGFLSEVFDVTSGGIEIFSARRGVAGVGEKFGVSVVPGTWVFPCDEDTWVGEEEQEDPSGFCRLYGIFLYGKGSAKENAVFDLEKMVGEWKKRSERQRDENGVGGKEVKGGEDAVCRLRQALQNEVRRLTLRVPTDVAQGLLEKGGEGAADIERSTGASVQVFVGFDGVQGGEQQERTGKIDSRQPPTSFAEIVLDGEPESVRAALQQVKVFRSSTVIRMRVHCMSVHLLKQFFQSNPVATIPKWRFAVPPPGSLFSHCFGSFVASLHLEGTPEAVQKVAFRARNISHRLLSRRGLTVLRVSASTRCYMLSRGGDGETLRLHELGESCGGEGFFDRSGQEVGDLPSELALLGDLQTRERMEDRVRVWGGSGVLEGTALSSFLVPLKRGARGFTERQRERMREVQDQMGKRVEILDAPISAEQNFSSSTSKLWVQISIRAPFALRIRAEKALREVFRESVEERAEGDDEQMERCEISPWESLEMRGLLSCSPFPPVSKRQPALPHPASEPFPGLLKVSGCPESPPQDSGRDRKSQDEDEIPFHAGKDLDETAPPPLSPPTTAPRESPQTVVAMTAQTVRESAEEVYPIHPPPACSFSLSHSLRLQRQADHADKDSSADSPEHPAVSEEGWKESSSFCCLAENFASEKETEKAKQKESLVPLSFEGVDISKSVRASVTTAREQIPPPPPQCPLSHAHTPTDKRCNATSSPNSSPNQRKKSQTEEAGESRHPHLSDADNKSSNQVASTSNSDQERQSFTAPDPSKPCCNSGSASPPPICQHSARILDHLAQSRCLIVKADPGSGKTAGLPAIFAHGADKFPPGHILFVQPGRKAAVRAASLAAHYWETALEGAAKDVFGCVLPSCDRSPGRLGTFTSAKHFLALVKEDPKLKKWPPAKGEETGKSVCLVVVEEAHRRRVKGDLALGLLKGILSDRADFRVVISTPVVNTSGFLDLFADGPVASCLEISSGGPTVECRFMPQQNSLPPRGPLSERRGREEPRRSSCSASLRSSPPSSSSSSISSPEGVPDVDCGHVIEELCRGLEKVQSGHALVFLPGEEEVARCVGVFEEIIREGELQRHLPTGVQLKVLSFTEDSSTEKVKEVLWFASAANESQRLVVFCTNIAETEVHVPGVCLVLDSGRDREWVYSERQGICVPQLRWICRAAASQRRKAADGRGPGAGLFVRLYRQDDISVVDYEPELWRSCLDSVVLQIANLGADPLSFPLLVSPGTDNLAGSVNRLRRLGLCTVGSNGTALFSTTTPVSPQAVVGGSEEKGKAECSGRTSWVAPFGRSAAECLDLLSPSLAVFLLRAVGLGGASFVRTACEVTALLAAGSGIVPYRRLPVVVPRDGEKGEVKGGDGGWKEVDERLLRGERCWQSVTGRQRSDLLSSLLIYRRWKSQGGQCEEKCGRKERKDECFECRGEYERAHGMDREVLQFVEKTSAMLMHKLLAYMPEISGPGGKQEEQKDEGLMHQEDTEEIIGRALARSFPEKVAEMKCPEWVGQGVRLCLQTGRGGGARRSSGAPLELNALSAWTRFVLEGGLGSSGYTGLFVGLEICRDSGGSGRKVVSQCHPLKRDWLVGEMSGSIGEDLSLLELIPLTPSGGGECMRGVFSKNALPPENSLQRPSSFPFWVPPLTGRLADAERGLKETVRTWDSSCALGTMWVPRADADGAREWLQAVEEEVDAFEAGREEAIRMSWGTGVAQAEIGHGVQLRSLSLLDVMPRPGGLKGGPCEAQLGGEGRAHLEEALVDAQVSASGNGNICVPFAQSFSMSSEIQTSFVCPSARDWVTGIEKGIDNLLTQIRSFLFSVKIKARVDRGNSWRPGGRGVVCDVNIFDRDPAVVADAIVRARVLLDPLHFDLEGLKASEVPRSRILKIWLEGKRLHPAVEETVRQGGHFEMGSSDGDGRKDRGGKWVRLHGSPVVRTQFEEELERSVQRFSKRFGVSRLSPAEGSFLAASEEGREIIDRVNAVLKGRGWVELVVSLEGCRLEHWVNLSGVTFWDGGVSSFVFDEKKGSEENVQGMEGELDEHRLSVDTGVRRVLQAVRRRVAGGVENEESECVFCRRFFPEHPSVECSSFWLCHHAFCLECLAQEVLQFSSQLQERADELALSCNNLVVPDCEAVTETGAGSRAFASPRDHPESPPIDRPTLRCPACNIPVGLPDVHKALSTVSAEGRTELKTLYMRVIRLGTLQDPSFASVDVGVCPFPDCAAITRPSDGCSECACCKRLSCGRCGSVDGLHRDVSCEEFFKMRRELSGHSLWQFSSSGLEGVEEGRWVGTSREEYSKSLMRTRRAWAARVLTERGRDFADGAGEEFAGVRVNEHLSDGNSECVRRFWRGLECVWLEQQEALEGDGDFECLGEFLQLSAEDVIGMGSFMWHGTDVGRIEEIFRWNFDPMQRGRGTGQLYGIGEYFGENAGECAAYAKNGPELILSFVLKGGHQKVVQGVGVRVENPTNEAASFCLPLMSLSFSAAGWENLRACRRTATSGPGSSKTTKSGGKGTRKGR
uniref:Helicase C-terminal domain-containing protein n=1 Tax=Chromera velia CCMP2878 TaxID=1169474 RepID=A0A0G4HXG9_9ALVE|eukprot:Cvel_1489.t1-p1 / transcript=Cvel_1489.t1 / gene=Cvel_1489 / organism=Chromera_velia_CCMP2878 / gene_product=Probable ATP-dependent RNA helicase DHX34, putative / transcript_product=Probable ATP-dependent RNA helicase DHX34, putative / location=Cvel_scaffold52:57699-68637(+) / protein_length=2667 / sequence_SO=supercontig / SO=protein_coding / is_pseudo=false